MAMKLIADAGATKTSWVIIPGQNMAPSFFETKGLNPLQLTDEDIISTLQQVSDITRQTGNPDSICFYGAGCANSIISNRILNYLKEIFKCEDISVESDMIGAARALFNRKDGIACILGTGSNSCVYKNDRITAQTPSLGYVLGDEGSGAALGKRLLGDIFKKQLPTEIVRLFEDEYALSVSELIEKVYREPRPAAYLASFTPFLRKYSYFSEVKSLIIQEFSRFFKRNVLNYPETGELPVGFVGSVAYYFSDFLLEASAKYDLTVSGILSSPAEGLVTFHTDI